MWRGGRCRIGFAISVYRVFVQAICMRAKTLLVTNADHAFGGRGAEMERCFALAPRGPAAEYCCQWGEDVRIGYSMD